jgi:hypothetical protein
VGQFVALTVEQEELGVGIPFYVEKVLEFEQRKWAEKMKSSMVLAIHENRSANRIGM